MKLIKQEGNYKLYKIKDNEYKIFENNEFVMGITRDNGKLDIEKVLEDFNELVEYNCIFL